MRVEHKRHGNFFSSAIFFPTVSPSPAPPESFFVVENPEPPLPVLKIQYEELHDHGPRRSIKQTIDLLKNSDPAAEDWPQEEAAACSSPTIKTTVTASRLQLGTASSGTGQRKLARRGDCAAAPSPGVVIQNAAVAPRPPTGGSPLENEPRPPDGQNLGADVESPAYPTHSTVVVGQLLGSHREYLRTTSGLDNKNMTIKGAPLPAISEKSLSICAIPATRRCVGDEAGGTRAARSAERYRRRRSGERGWMFIFMLYDSLNKSSFNRYGETSAHRHYPDHDIFSSRFPPSAASRAQSGQPRALKGAGQLLPVHDAARTVVDSEGAGDRARPSRRERSFHRSSLSRSRDRKTEKRIQHRPCEDSRSRERRILAQLGVSNQIPRQLGAGNYAQQLHIKSKGSASPRAHLQHHQYGGNKLPSPPGANGTNDAEGGGDPSSAENQNLLAPPARDSSTGASEDLLSDAGTFSSYVSSSEVSSTSSEESSFLSDDDHEGALCADLGGDGALDRGGEDARSDGSDAGGSSVRSKGSVKIARYPSGERRGFRVKKPSRATIDAALDAGLASGALARRGGVEVGRARLANRLNKELVPGPASEGWVGPRPATAAQQEAGGTTRKKFQFSLCGPEGNCVEKMMTMFSTAG